MNVNSRVDVTLSLTAEIVARINRVREPGSTLPAFLVWLIVCGVGDAEEEYARHRASVARAWSDGYLQALGALEDEEV